MSAETPLHLRAVDARVLQDEHAVEVLLDGMVVARVVVQEAPRSYVRAEALVLMRGVEHATSHSWDAEPAQPIAHTHQGTERRVVS